MQTAFRFALPSAATLALAAGFLAASPKPAAAICTADSNLIGSVCWMAANYCPEGYLQANGQQLPINSYQALFSLLGVTYGGSYPNTFALPDLRGRMPVGTGMGPGLSNVTIGQPRGAESKAVTLANLALHDHALPSAPIAVTLTSHSPISTAAATAATPTLADGDTAYLMNATGGSALKGLYTKTAPAEGAIATLPVTASGTATLSGTTGTAGTGTAPVATVNPELALTPCISVWGLYPVRP